MSSPRKVNLQAIIAGDVAPAIVSDPEPQPAPVVEPIHPEIAVVKPGPKLSTLKDRAHQLSVYLEPPVYERLRLLAFEERTKMHVLMLEAVDLLLKKRGQPSIKKLVGS
jgi:hypothetical protein